MKGRKNRLNAGETLAEAMVSALLFLLMMALIQGAVSFCSNAQKKSARLREQNALICTQLRGHDRPGAQTPFYPAFQGGLPPVPPFGANR